MAYQVLVIGGSYFLGRIFCYLASQAGDMELTLVNRGRYSMIQYPHLREYRCDRHDAAGLSALPAGDWDAVVDLCAYAPGDISFLAERLPGRARRYIYISTADVYARSPGLVPDEDSPLQERKGEGAAGEYSWHKRLLETELGETGGALGMETVSLRPAFIYGPYNYAPRESWYIREIVLGNAVPVPADADGQFQFVYVKDAANAILACIRQDAAANRVYNLAAPEILTYPAFTDTLRLAADRPFRTREVTLRQVLAENIPLPFPLTAAESETYRGDRIVRELGLEYTPFREGLEKTFRSFRSVYE
jgi:nucleoside-diphosphate-sugar epimerase